MRKSLFISLLIFASVSLGAQQRHALLIGIGNYPEDSGWPSIHGDNDIHIVKELLLKQGFAEENISTLKNADATKGKIVAAMTELKNQSNRGDVIYIHFSGHGQQVTDLDGDEEDNFDEAWVPYDAQQKYAQGVYEGENHILDDELNVYLNGLRAKIGPQGKIVLVSDACHSGSGSRGLRDADEEYLRGTDDKFIIPSSGANVIKKDAPVYWLYIGACKPYQSNYEYKAGDGLFYGSLSYVISSADVDLVMSDYRDVLNQWRNMLVEITRYPQDMDEEGRPSRKSNLMF